MSMSHGISSFLWHIWPWPGQAEPHPSARRGRDFPGNRTASERAKRRPIQSPRSRGISDSVTFSSHGNLSGLFGRPTGRSRVRPHRPLSQNANAISESVYSKHDGSSARANISCLGPRGLGSPLPSMKVKSLES